MTKNNMLFDALMRSTEECKKKGYPERRHAMEIYLDEQTGQIKERKLDSAGASANVNNPAKLIHDSIFH